MSAHTCPAPGCDLQVPSNMLACRTHWFLIPKPLRDQLWRAYRDHGQYSEAHIAAVNACCDWLEQNVAANA